MASVTPIREDTEGHEVSVDEMRDFLMVVRRALLLIVRFIEKRYAVESKPLR